MFVDWECLTKQTFSETTNFPAERQRLCYLSSRIYPLAMFMHTCGSCHHIHLPYQSANSHQCTSATRCRCTTNNVTHTTASCRVDKLSKAAGRLKFKFIWECVSRKHHVARLIDSNACLDAYKSDFRVILCEHEHSVYMNVWEYS